MGFHFEEEHILGGSIDNRTKGKTVITINFTNHTSSLVTLQGNPCRDLAGSLWNFRHPFAKLDAEPGEPCFFIPPLCEGSVGHISYTRKTEVPVLPIDEHYDRLFDEDKEDPPMKIAPVLDLEWFSQKFGQVEVDCQQIALELVEMAWSLGEEEAAEGAQLVKKMREEVILKSQESMAGFYEEMELIEEYVAEDPEPHGLEEQCFLIVQEFILNSADDSEEKLNLHSDLLKLQEQIAGAFIHYDGEGNFEDIPRTIKLLDGVLPFIERAATGAKSVTETTANLLEMLHMGVYALRERLAGQQES